VTRRILLAYLSLTLVVLVVLEVPLGIAYQRDQLDELTSDVERDAVALASFSEDVLEGTDDRDLQQVADGYAEQTGGRVVIVDDEGDAITDSEPLGSGPRSFSSRPEIAQALDGEVATGTRRSNTLDTELVYVAVPVASGGTVHGAVRITFPAGEVQERILQNWLSLGLIALVTLAAATTVGVLVARWVVRPVHQLEQTATRLGRGDLAVRAPIDGGPPEVQSLALAFNETATRLEDLVNAQEAFVADASHQLRTPLTALQLRLENLAADLEGSPAADDVDAGLREVARLSRLVDGLLTLARAERSGARASAQPTDVGALLADRVEVWSGLAAEEGVRLALDAPDDLRVRATPERVASALDNLVANAIEVSPDGGTVTLRADPTASGTVELHVLDEGPGMDEEAHERALDRFWRGASGPTRLSGNGLGLPIAQKLARSDGGDLRLDQAPRGGVDAVLVLPADQGGSLAER
jgi:signal transduction histidine kinase